MIVTAEQFKIQSYVSRQDSSRTGRIIMFQAMLQIKVSTPVRKQDLVIDSIKMGLSRQQDHVYLHRLRTVPTLQNIRIYSPKKTNQQRQRSINVPRRLGHLVSRNHTPGDRWKDIQAAEYQHIRSQVQLDKASLEMPPGSFINKTCERPQVIIKDLTIDSEIESQKRRLLHNKDSRLFKPRRKMTFQIESSLAESRPTEQLTLLKQLSPEGLSINLPRLRQHTLPNEQISRSDDLPKSKIGRKKKQKIQFSPWESRKDTFYE